MLHLGLFILGFVGGTFVVPQVLRWVALIHTGATRHGGDFLGPLHPGLWLVGFAIWFTAGTFSGSLPTDWYWCLGGFYSSVLLLGLTALATLRAQRQTPEDGTAEDTATHRRIGFVSVQDTSPQAAPAPVTSWTDEKRRGRMETLAWEYLTSIVSW